MAVQYETDPNHHLVRTTFTGVVTRWDQADYQASLRCNRIFDPAFSELIHFEMGAEIQLSFMDFRLEDDPFSRASKRAIVASQPEVYRIARLFQLARRDDPNVQIFATTGEAELWLGLG